MPAAPPPTVVAPVSVSGGNMRVDAAFNSDAYFAMNRVVVKPDPDLKIANFAAIVSGTKSEAVTNANPALFEAYTTLFGLSYTAYNNGKTERLRTAGKALFDALSTTAPATVPVKTVTDGAAQLLYAAALDGQLADDPAAAALRTVLQNTLAAIGTPVALPAPPPVPLPDAIVVRTDDTFVFDGNAEARGYTASVKTVVDPVKRTVGQTQEIWDAVPAGIAATPYTAGYNRDQLGADLPHRHGTVCGVVESARPGGERRP